MASLNTLRTKGGIIVSLVIGIALLAFLLGDFLGAGSQMVNSRKMRVGEIDGKKIGYVEFLNQSDYMGDMIRILWNKDAFNAEEQEVVYNMAWEALIMKYAYEPGFERLGIMPSVGEKADMVTGAYVSPIVTTMFADPQTGTFSTEVLRTFLANADSDPRSAQLWNYLKNQMTEQRVMAKYAALIGKGIFVNDLEVARGVEAADRSYAIDYISKPYTSVADSLVTVAQSDIQAYYDAHPQSFRQAESRDIEYVVFDLLPSEDDYAQAKEYIDQIAEEFAVSENPMQYALLNSQERPEQRYFKESELDNDRAAIAFGVHKGEMIGPELKNDVYTISRLADEKRLPDTLGARHIVLAAGDGLADSLVAVLRGGADFAAVAEEYSLDTRSAAQGGDLGRFAYDQVPDDFAEAALAARVGDIFTLETGGMVQIVKLTYKSPLSTKAQIATITYRVDPSDLTQQEVYGKASAFLTAAMGGYEQFRQAADDAVLSKRTVRILNTDRNISGMQDSRELVRWAFTSNEGAVSPIMELDGNYVVAALIGIRNEGIAPLEQVNADIRSRLLREKKGEYLAAQMKGATLAENAEALETEVKQAENVKFNSFFVPGIGVEPELIGAVAGATENVLSKPVQGATGVFLFDVTGTTATSTTTAEDERVRLEAAAQNYLEQRLAQALQASSDITDMRVKFF